MFKKNLENIFYIGIMIFSLTLFTEHLFLGETNITNFIKGFACGFILLGVIILFINRTFPIKS
jgi:hypothetical protein